MDVKKSVRLDTDKKIKLESLDIFGNALYVGIGAATGMAQLPFGALPFGFALLCAVPQKRVAAVLAGLLFSSLAQANSYVRWVRTVDACNSSTARHYRR